MSTPGTTTGPADDEQGAPTTKPPRRRGRPRKDPLATLAAELGDHVQIVASDEAVLSDPSTDPFGDGEQGAPTTPPRRRGRPRKTPAESIPPAESAPADDEPDPGTAEVIYLGDSDADRLARTQGRIRTKKGRYLRSMTDLGNVERYLDRYAGDLVFVDESERWRGFNGRHWADTTKDRELHKRVVKVLREIWKEAEQCRDAADATETRKWAKKSEERSSISAVKSLLISECAVSIEDFDQRGSEADTLNLANGTLDLETFELRPHAKEDMLSKFSPITYDPAATAPNWERHLAWAIPDADTRETVQRYLGYALTTETREQKMMCFYGPKGRNGKGIVVRVVERILGYDERNSRSSEHSYAQAAQASLLLAGKRGLDAASPDMADLVGKRFVSLQETSVGQKFDEVRVKSLTGGDAIRARFLNQNPFQFTPVAKYVLCTNNRPEVINDDPALWRRLLLVNFPNSISDEARDADPDYEERIHGELSGILNWLLDGLRKWRADGLAVSDAIRADTEAYRAEQDWFAAFMEDCLEEREAHMVLASAAYSVYQKWAQESGQGVLAKRRFRALLGTRIDTLYTRKAGNPAEWYYGGLAFREGAIDAFDAGRSRNPVQREDPSSPPPEHTAHYAAQRRAAAAREAAAAAQAAEPTLAPEPEPAPAAPQAAPAARPLLISLDSLSALCRADQHARCADARATGEVGECWCPCHEPGEDSAPADFDPTPDPAETIDPAERDAVLAQFGESEHDIDAAIDTPASPAPAETRYSQRTFIPWTVKMSAYVNLATGEGITDAGDSFEIRKRGKLASLAELLRALPADVKYVHLTGADIGTGTELMTWANGRLAKGWTAADRAHDSDETRDRVSLRYRRTDADGGRTQVTIYRAANWIDRDHETTTTPADLRAAFALLLTGIREVFGDVVGDDYGVPLKGTPAATGIELIRRTLPRDRSRTPHRYPVLPNDIQTMIRSHAGQARHEDFAAATHPSGGANLPDRIPGLYVYDMRFCYAALLDLELPSGPVIRDEVPEFARRGTGWEPCLYRVRVTVPAGWDRAGRFRTRDDGDRWIYPATPGTTFESWAWDRALHAADRDGWTLGEHVQILERFRFTGPKTKPLGVFGRALRELRDGWIPAQDDTTPDAVRELARIMARQIAIAAIGKLSGTPYGKLRSCPADDLAARPTDGRSVWRSDDGKRWEWREAVTDPDALTHPEWSAYIWAVCREWLYDHPAQRGVGLRHVPLSELVAARTDGFWTTTPQPVEDTGKVGHFRCQLAHSGEIATPRTYSDLNAVRAALLDEAGTR